jgi:hypothetical protein
MQSGDSARKEDTHTHSHSLTHSLTHTLTHTQVKSGDAASKEEKQVVGLLFVKELVLGA